MRQPTEKDVAPFLIGFGLGGMTAITLVQWPWLLVPAAAIAAAWLYRGMKNTAKHAELQKEQDQ